MIRDLLGGKRRYSEFLASPERITTNVLADRLRRLERAGLVHTVAYQQHPPRHEYHLTDSGRALLPAIRALAHWGADNIVGASDTTTASATFGLAPDSRTPRQAPPVSAESSADQGPLPNVIRTAASPLALTPAVSIDPHRFIGGNLFQATLLAGERHSHRRPGQDHRDTRSSPPPSWARASTAPWTTGAGFARISHSAAASVSTQPITSMSR